MGEGDERGGRRERGVGGGIEVGRKWWGWGGWRVEVVAGGGVRNGSGSGRERRRKRVVSGGEWSWMGSLVKDVGADALHLPLVELVCLVLEKL